VSYFLHSDTDTLYKATSQVKQAIDNWTDFDGTKSRTDDFDETTCMRLKEAF